MTSNKKEEEKKNQDIEKELEECKKKAKEYLEGWQRERANFLNYKKEEIERVSEMIKFANEELILKILPVLDNLEKSQKHIPEKIKDKDYVKGIDQIIKQFQEILRSFGVERIEVLGKKFDPRFHEAVEEVEDKEKEKGIVVEEILAGYTIHGKILRPAKVKVSK